MAWPEILKILGKILGHWRDYPPGSVGTRPTPEGVACGNPGGAGGVPRGGHPMNDHNPRRFEVIVVAAGEPGRTTAILELRRWLKALGRIARIRCVSIREITPPSESPEDSP